MVLHLALLIVVQLCLMGLMIMLLLNCANSTFTNTGTVSSWVKYNNTSVDLNQQASGNGL
jgi:hypothetical protein